MPEKDAPSRRDVLKNVGAVGFAGGAMSVLPSSAAASGETLSKEGIQNILDTQEVSTIRDKVGSISVKEARTRKESPEGFSFSVKLATLSTDVGELLYGESESGDTVAKLKIADDLKQSQLPQEYRPIPHSSDAILVADGKSVTFMRTATDQEQRKALEAIDAEVEKSTVFYNSDVGGYEVQVETSNGVNRAFTIEVPGKGSINAGTVTELTNEGDVSTEGCATWCFGCAGSIGACGGCIMSCASVITLVGAVGCAVCVMGSCAGAAPIACAKCVDECS